MATPFEHQLNLVYTMGKVGSTSISSSLLTHGVQCLDVHVMSFGAMNWGMSDALKHKKFPSPHIGAALYARRDFYKPDRNVKIVTLVRDCVSRTISQEFQNLSKIREHTSASINAQISAADFSSGSNWFNNEFRSATKIDIFDTRFNTQDRHGYYKTDGIDVLLLRTDLDDADKGELISDFFRKKIVIARENISTNKWYSSLYTDFLEDGNIATDWIENALSTPIMQHFYTSDERSSIAHKFANLVELK
jgi:hypothetical protein